MIPSHLRRSLSASPPAIFLVTLSLLAFACLPGALGAVFSNSATEGTITKIDHAAKTVAIKTADGAEHTVHLAGRTVVHGGQETLKGADAAANGLKEGSKVVVHSTKKGSEETAEEIDRVGDDGLKKTDGTVTRFDRKAHTMTVKSEDGTEQAYQLSKNAAEDAGKDTDDAAKKSAHVSVYYSEEAGHKVAHFFKTL